MNISTETQAHEAVKKWQDAQPKVQIQNLHHAIESLELSMMYYEQKGNEAGIKRAEKCIDILREREKALNC